MSIFRQRLNLAILLCLVSSSAVISRTAVHECDRVAAHPEDDERAAPGVPWRDLDARAAVTACREAIAAYPRERRLRYQLGRGLTKAGQYDAAMEIFRPLADGGYAMAQSALGTLYAGGSGTPQDQETAVAWYRKAAEQGNTPGQNNLARMYLNGSGVERNFALAIEWFTKAGENGSAVARTNLGNLFYAGRGVARDYAKSAMWYRKAAELGHVEAQLYLALMYEHGRGVERDQAAAFKLYLKAAARGDMVARTSVGLMYRQGRGIARDDAQAVSWFHKAAAQHHAIAQNNLGLMYSQGRGVRRNDTTAVEWYRAAARQGYALAQNNLGLMYAEGRGVAKDEVKAAEWIRRAAEQGNADGQYNLGVLYSRGRGVPRDLAASARWHFKAARQDVAAGRGLRLPSSSLEMRVAYSAMAVVPALLMVWVLARRGRNRALAGTLWRTAGLGVMVAIGAALVGLVVSGTIPGSSEAGSQDIAVAFLAAAAPEELGRFCVLYFYCLKRGAFSRPMDGLICGIVAALGFSAFENALYAYGGGIEAVIVKSATTTPLHVSFGAIMGGLLALARGSPKRYRMMVGLGLFLPIVLHGLHNLVVLTAMGARASTNGGQGALVVASMAVILGLSLLVYWRLRKRDAA